MDNAPRNESQIAYHRRRLEELKKVRQPWESTWQSLADFIEPTRLRLTNKDEGATSRAKIIDSTGTFALRTLQSGMHSGLTSPARPWFRLTTYDPDMKDFAPVKTWLSQAEMRMREVFQSSNLYTAFHTGYGDLGQFGQSVAIMSEDDKDVINLNSMIHGRCWIARDHKGRITTLYRQFRWSVARIVGYFGLDAVRASSRTIADAYDQAKYDHIYDVFHAIEPRLNRDHNKLDKSNKPFLSNYWVDASHGAGENVMLKESGFDENPLIGPAWELVGEDHYAISPGMVAIGDVKMLQMEQQRKLEAIDKLVRPPMTGPTSMRNNPASLLPGALTLVDDPTGKGYRPAMEVQLRLAELAQDIRDTQERIRQAFYADLFLMLSNMEGVQPRNNLEIAERKEEKLLALGPVLENIYNGQLEPVIDRTFAILQRRGEIPPPPSEIQGKDLKIEYISMLAQAQKAVATGALERGVGFIGQLSAVKPDILDKLDADEAIDHYWDMLGAPPSALVPDDEVQKMRAARQQKQQMAENAQMAAVMAPAAKQGADAAAVLAGAQNNPGAADLLNRLGIGASI